MKHIMITILLIAITGSLLLNGCSDSESKSKNLEQIYSEEGIPVKIKKVQALEFSVSRQYNAVLTGIKESSAYARIDDKVEKIFYEVGDFVQQDAVVLTFPEDNPAANYFQAKLAYENAQASFERVADFFETGGISKQEYDNAETAFRIAQANWDAIKGSVKIKAPISGVLTRINVHESDNAEKEQELFVISQIDKLKAKIWVSDREIGSIKKGQDAQAVWNEHILEGRVIQVDLHMNQAKQAFGVMLEFDNTDGKIPFGVTAEVSIKTFVKADAVVTERKNLLKEKDKFYVFLNNNNIASKKEVLTGQTSGLEMEILQGLNVGDELIVEGQMLLEDGSKIKVVE